MITPKLSVNIYEPSFLFSGYYDNGGGNSQPVGRYLEAEFPNKGGNLASGTSFAVSQIEEDARCLRFGILLYEVFSHLSISPSKNERSISQELPTKKKVRKSPSVADFPSSAQRVVGNTTYVPLVDLGFPSSLCMIVQVRYNLFWIFVQAVFLHLTQEN